MDRKKEKIQKVNSLEKFLKLVIVPIEKLCWREIDEFRKDWKIPGDGFITEKELENWDNTIQKIIPKKKYNVVYQGHEIIYEVEDGKIVNMTPLDYFEKYSRILERAKGIEPSVSSLARKHFTGKLRPQTFQTTELPPLLLRKYIKQSLFSQGFIYRKINVHLYLSLNTTRIMFIPPTTALVITIGSAAFEIPYKSQKKLAVMKMQSVVNDNPFVLLVLAV